MPDPKPGKKRKSADSGDSSNKKTKDADMSTTIDGFSPFSLDEIRNKVQALATKVPEIPEDTFGLTKGELHQALIKEWAATLQAILEEFNLLVCCVATACYKWGTDRSGAADQHLSLLSGELGSSQDQIASTVTPRLTNILAPVVDLVIEKVVTTKNEKGEEVKENQFIRKLVDPDFVVLCHRILARNAHMLRQVVLSNFQKILKALKDYLKAQKNDTQHSRGFTY
mmetsp:Transcript_8375/g.20147  ORF Transcript_8375/g.20147 Transcript_8375/m.20147 type:complete len:226 (+) Transcript_8375:95-772(+)|eukprot:CAMPEP_0113644144 /NCGR_PEP_ID=MMETSP0017_2-20120614/23227_1 /TAXON_ID=2856 /ORGANISM="Cylindrotheca closterium" /LENGTH=225 /DNA_ID=CAMNT_0000555727 /DNA_START=45 /DNA_END=722 /DNA_ORIENTATION=- /assembly_acc=CAM_ASM_000147